jgi:hypothetical protein
MGQVPPPTDAVWDRLVSGSTPHKFKLFAANMALARAVRIAGGDPARKPEMITEFQQFCTKYAAQVADELHGLS